MVMVSMIIKVVDDIWVWCFGDFFYDKGFMKEFFLDKVCIDEVVIVLYIRLFEEGVCVVDVIRCKG